ncbi:MAG: 1,2-phenylacetyl-CoA epoxidase subunit PaaD, partial [Actinomycetes bacterium]
GIIEQDILATLHKHGVQNPRVRLVYSPAWTTDWMTEQGRRALDDFGIAPPAPRALASEGPVLVALSVRCPQCRSTDTREQSHFGSTACKSLWVCNACREPFDHFKAI